MKKLVLGFVACSFLAVGCNSASTSTTPGKATAPPAGGSSMGDSMKQGHDGASKGSTSSTATTAK